MALWEGRMKGCRVLGCRGAAAASTGVGADSGELVGSAIFGGVSVGLVGLVGHDGRIDRALRVRSFDCVLY